LDLGFETNYAVRLGSDGPELLIRLTSDGVPVTMLPKSTHGSSVETRPLGSPRPKDIPTIPSSESENGSFVDGAPQETRDASGEEPRERAHRAGYQGEQKPLAERGNAGKREGHQFSTAEATMIEQQLKTIRNLLTATLLLVIVLLGVIVYQVQQASENQTKLQKVQDQLLIMQSQASDAIKAFQPQLDQRLTRFETRLDGMDAKFKESEDHFVARMDQEMPAILDRYLDRSLDKKLSQLARKIAAMSPCQTPR